MSIKGFNIGGTTYKVDYPELDNLPQINGNDLVGNMSGESLGLREVAYVPYIGATNAQVETLLDSGVKIVLVNVLTDFLPQLYTKCRLVKRISATEHQFAAITQSKCVYATLKNNSWSVTSETYAKPSDVPQPSTTPGHPLGVAAVGASAEYARADHAHAMPAAEDVGAIPDPTTKSSGQVLTYNGYSWVASTPSGGVVDSALSSSSTNPVQNKAIKAAVDAKYTKPAGGIPKSDLASDVQNGLSVVIDFEYVEQDTDGTTQILSTNVTPSEIYSAYQAGSVVMARYTNEDLIMPLCSPGEYSGTVMFSAEFNGSEWTIWSDDLTDNTVWYFGSTYMIPPHLRPGSVDDGKIQVARNGIWTAAQPTMPMGHLDSTSTATVMTATVPGITELRDGVFVWLCNGVITSASGVTLNINGLGAKPIYNSLSGAVVTTTFTAASSYLFVYNPTRISGGCWDMVYGYDANTTYTPAKLGQGYAVCSTAAATVAKTASISSYTLVAGGIVAIKFTNDVPANATLNITSKGAKAIYYKGAAITAGVIKAGDTVTMIYSTYYHVLSIDRWGSDIAALENRLDSLLNASGVSF